MEHKTTSKLRVLVVTENFLPKIDGVTRTLSRLLEHLQEQGHEVLLLGPSCDIATYAGHEVLGAKYSVPLWFYPGLSLNFFRPDFLRKAVAFQPDVIHYVDPIWLSAQAQPILRYALPDCASVASYHTNLARYARDYGYGFLAGIMWTLQRHLHGNCMATFCPSNSTRNILCSQSFRNLRIWPRGIDISLFSPMQRKPNLREQWAVPMLPASRSRPTEMEHIIITYVGRLSSEKNIDLLINAFIKLNARLKVTGRNRLQCSLVLVGDGPARARLEEQTKGLDVVFMGYQKGEALAACYASSDLFAFPSHSETFGNVVLEAMASGLPVVGLRAEGFLLELENLPGAQVAKNASGIPANVQELFEANKESYKLAVDGFAKLLLALVLEPDLRRKMGEAAASYAATRTWDQAMECLLHGYREAATMTRQKRLEKQLSTLPRISSTSSLTHVKTEEPPFAGDTEEHDNFPVSGESSSSSIKLLFGRPPIMKLLRRSTRTALRDSISRRVTKTLNRQTLLIGESYQMEERSTNHFTYLFFCFILLFILAFSYDTIVGVYLAFKTSLASLHSISL